MPKTEISLETINPEPIPFEDEFWDNVKYNASRAHKMAKPKRRGIVRYMKANEVLAKIEKIGIKTTERTLQRYVKDGLIPIPYRRSAGRGRGKIVDYDKNTATEFCASYTLRRGRNKYPVRDVKNAREIALKMGGDFQYTGEEENKYFAVDGKVVTFIVNKELYDLFVSNGKFGDLIINPDGSLVYKPSEVTVSNLYLIIANMWMQNKLKAKAGFNPLDEAVILTVIKKDSKNAKSKYLVSVYKMK